MQIIFFGVEHSSAAEYPQGIAPTIKKRLKKSYCATRRGLLIAKSSFQSPHLLVQPYFLKFRGGVLTPIPFASASIIISIN